MGVAIGSIPLVEPILDALLPDAAGRARNGAGPVREPARGPVRGRGHAGGHWARRPQVWGPDELAAVLRGAAGRSVHGVVEHAVGAARSVQQPRDDIAVVALQALAPE